MNEPQKVLYEGKDFYIQREGSQLVAITRISATEYSRLDLKTKKATHWYARKICERIYNFFKDKEAPLNICCLGSAMGAVPFELLTHYENATVTCVDIDRESLHVLEHSILKSFGQRVILEEMDAKLFANELETNEFDIIINDLFSEQESPPFIHSNSFLRNIFRGLKPNGVYFANTITDTFLFTHGIAIEKIGYDFVRYTKRPQGITNIVYEVVKN